MAKSASSASYGLGEPLDEVPVTSDEEIRRGAKELKRKEERVLKRARPGQQLNLPTGDGAGPRALNQGDNKLFPVQLVPEDDRDEKLAVKTQLLTSIPNSRIDITDADAEWALDKLQVERQKEFVQYLLNRFDWNEPATFEKMSRLFPEVVEAQKAEIDKKAELQKQLAYLVLQNGRPQTKEQFLLLHMLESGVIRVPKQPLWYPGSGDDDTWADGYNRGIFNPGRYFYWSTTPGATGISRNNLLNRLTAGPAGGPLTSRIGSMSGGQNLPASFSSPSFANLIARRGV